MASGRKTTHLKRSGAILIALASTLTSVMLIAAGTAVAATKNNNTLYRNQYFTGSPKEGASTCQHRYVTLAKLPSSERWAWAEQTDQSLINYEQTFHGKFYWTVCVDSMKGKSAGWTYSVNSMLTKVTSACEHEGHCTTYELEYHYYFWSGGKDDWGSEIYMVPDTACNFWQCEMSEGTVTKVTS